MAKENLAPLVLKAQSGNKDALNDLLAQTYETLYYYAYNTVKNEDLAADITQESCEEIIKTIGNLRNPEAFKTWAGRIVAHQCSRYYRQTKDEVYLDENEDGETILDQLPDDSRGTLPEQVQEDKEFKKLMWQMLDKLPEEQRQALVLYYMEDLSVPQIAQIQGKPEGTIKSRLNYGRKAVIAQVNEYEKKHNIKLHSLAPLPLLLYFLFRENMAQVLADSAATLEKVWQNISGAVAGTAVAGAAAVGTAATAGAAATGTGTATAATAAAAGSGLTAKIIAGVVAAVVTVGAVVGGIAIAQDKTHTPTDYDHSGYLDTSDSSNLSDTDPNGPGDEAPTVMHQKAVGHWESLSNPGMEIDVLVDGSARINGQSYIWEQGEMIYESPWSWLKIKTSGDEWVYNVYLMNLSDDRYTMVLAEPDDASHGFSNGVALAYNRIALFYRPADYEGYTLVPVTTENIMDYLKFSQEFQFMEYFDGSVADDVYLNTSIRFKENVGAASYCVVDFIYEISTVQVQIDMENRTGSILQTLETRTGKDSDRKWEDGRDYNSEIQDSTWAGASDFIRRPEEHTITQFETQMESHLVIGVAKAYGFVLVPPEHAIDDPSVEEAPFDLDMLWGTWQKMPYYWNPVSESFAVNQDGTLVIDDKTLRWTGMNDASVNGHRAFNLELDPESTGELIISGNCVTFIYQTDGTLLAEFAQPQEDGEGAYAYIYHKPEWYTRTPVSKENVLDYLVMETTHEFFDDDDEHPGIDSGMIGTTFRLKDDVGAISQINIALEVRSSTYQVTIDGENVTRTKLSDNGTEVMEISVDANYFGNEFFLGEYPEFTGTGPYTIEVVYYEIISVKEVSGELYFPV